MQGLCVSHQKAWVCVENLILYPSRDLLVVGRTSRCHGYNPSKALSLPLTRLPTQLNRVLARPFLLYSSGIRLLAGEPLHQRQGGPKRPTHALVRGPPRRHGLRLFQAIFQRLWQSTNVRRRRGNASFWLHAVICGVHVSLGWCLMFAHHASF